MCVYMHEEQRKKLDSRLKSLPILLQDEKIKKHKLQNFKYSNFNNKPSTWQLLGD